jgi:hypothetical protein
MALRKNDITIMIRTKDVIMMSIEGASAKMVMRNTIWSVTATSAGFSVPPSEIEIFGRVWATSAPADTSTPKKIALKFLRVFADIDKREKCVIC